MATKPRQLPAYSVKKAYTPREERRQTWQRCTLYLSDKYAIEGIIMDKSENGLRLRFRGHETLPTIVHVKSSATGIDTHMRVMWQHQGDAGLRRL